MNTNIYLNNYNERSIYDSNCVEFWAPVTDRVIPNIAENRYWISTFGNTYNSRTKRSIGLSMHKKGYLQFSLLTKDQKQITRKLHRVLMLSFCYFPGCERFEVNHRDGVKTHNWITNLEWATHSENTIHAINNGLKTVFGNEVEVLLNDIDVKRILDLYHSGYSYNEILNILNIPGLKFKLVQNICTNKCRLSYFNNLYSLN